MFDTLAGILRKVPEAPAEIPDYDLLRRFLDNDDKAAFELIVRRHGFLVLGVCRRILLNRADAEDAFQATFLLLLRKANSIRKEQSLPSWLYKVAYRAALRLRTQRANHASRLEKLAEQMGSQHQPDTTNEIEWKELGPILDEEISRLPRKLRDVVVLCYLEGKTNIQAAQSLGCPKGTVLSRLSRAREKLARTFMRRGLGVVFRSTTAAIERNRGTMASISPVLVYSTMNTAVLFKAANLSPRALPAWTAELLGAKTPRGSSWGLLSIVIAVLIGLLLATGTVLSNWDSAWHELTTGILNPSSGCGHSPE